MLFSRATFPSPRKKLTNTEKKARNERDYAEKKVSKHRAESSLKQHMVYLDHEVSLDYVTVVNTIRTGSDEVSDAQLMAIFIEVRKSEVQHIRGTIEGSWGKQLPL